jgi:hypothetical protein
MKKLLMFLAIVFMLTACESKSGKLSHEHMKVKTESRIKEIESKYIGNVSYTILEVDGHLYLSQFRGGIIHLESCPCKNK